MANPWLVLHGGALGDLVLTLHLALRLPGTRQSGRIELVSRTNPGDLRTCNPGIQRRSSEGLGLHWLFDREVGGQSAAPDHSTHRSDSGPALLRALIAGRRVLNCLSGPDSPVHQRLGALGAATLLSLDPRPGHGVQRHIVDQWQARLEAQGLLIPKCPSRTRQPQLGVPEDLRQRGATLLRRAGCSGRPLLIHPGSGGRAKCWPLRGFVELAEHLQRGAQETAGGGCRVCFLVGPAEAETWPAARIDQVKVAFPALVNPSANEQACLLAAAGVFVGNDAGPAHLAALLGTPTVVLFGPTSPVLWRPLGRSVRVLAGDPAADSERWGIAPAHVAQLVGDTAAAAPAQ